MLRNAMVLNDHTGCDVCLLRNSVPIQGIIFTRAADKFCEKEKKIRIPF